MGKTEARSRGSAGGPGRRPARRAQADVPRALRLTRLNWSLLGGGIAVVAVGFGSAAAASPFVSIVLAPVLLVVGYAVLIPLGLIL